MILVAGVTVLSQHRLSIRLALGLLGGLCGFVVAAVVGTYRYVRGKQRHHTSHVPLQGAVLLLPLP